MIYKIFILGHVVNQREEGLGEASRNCGGARLQSDVSTSRLAECLGDQTISHVLKHLSNNLIKRENTKTF